MVYRILIKWNETDLSEVNRLTFPTPVFAGTTFNNTGYFMYEWGGGRGGPRVGKEGGIYGGGVGR